MTVTYLSRSLGTGHSLENLFGVIRQELTREPGVVATSIQLPHISTGLRSVWRNIRFVARQRLDGIVHVTGDVHYAVLVLPRSHTVLTIHDCSTLEKNRDRWLRYWVFWLLWFYLPVRRAAALTVVSEKSRLELIRYVGRVAEKAVVIANACDPCFVYQPGVFRQHEPVLLQIGTAPHKNVLRLLDAIEPIPCQLILVGPLSDGITRALQSRQIKFQHFINVSQDDIRQLYAACDIVTFVSTYEGFGMPIVEANAVGRPVITADRSPMREVAGKAAHLVDPTDSIAIRQGIRRLIDDEAYRQQLMAEGLRNATTYSAPVVAARYRSVYQQLTSDNQNTEGVSCGY